MNLNSSKIIIAGDLLPADSNVLSFINGDSNELCGEDIVRLFANARFSIANLEGALTDSVQKQVKAGPSLKAPMNSARGIKSMGLDAVSLANNHVTDYGVKGLEDTICALANNGITPVGYGTVDDLCSHISVDVVGKKVCIYCVSEVFNNEPTKERIGANVYDEYLVCNELRELKTTHDYVVVMYHGGAEYFQYATPLVRKRCHRMIDSGADIIFTQHTHCIGCEENYQGGYILYGQGNFFFAHQKSHPNLTKEGLLVELDFSKENVSIVKYPVAVINDKYVRINHDFSFDQFNERTMRNLDREWVVSQYQSYKLDEISIKYLLACKGRSRYWNLYRRFFPERFRTQLLKSYSKKNILVILDMLHSTRRNEDMHAVWCYLYEMITKDRIK